MTGATTTRPTTAPAPAPGRETCWLGHCWHRTPWQASPHHRQQQWRLFLGRYWFFLDHYSTLFLTPPNWPSPPYNKRPADCVLGGTTADVHFRGKYYTWDFLLADVQFHIIGADFLQHFQFLVDVAANILRPATSTPFRSSLPFLLHPRSSLLLHFPLWRHLH